MNPIYLKNELLFDVDRSRGMTKTTSRERLATIALKCMNNPNRCSYKIIIDYHLKENKISQNKLYEILMDEFEVPEKQLRELAEVLRDGVLPAYKFKDLISNLLK